MSKTGNIDIRAFKAMQKKLQRINTGAVENFCINTNNELTARLLRKVKYRTPVKTGELRRNWQAESTKKQGNKYHSTVFNPTEYAMYVEYGHRTKSGSGWIQGRFMLTRSVEEFKPQASKLVQAKWHAFMNEVMRNGK